MTSKATNGELHKAYCTCDFCKSLDVRKAMREIERQINATHNTYNTVDYVAALIITAACAFWFTIGFIVFTH